MSHSPDRSPPSLLIAFLFGAALIVSGSIDAAPTPNVLFILADDLGYMDVNSFAERLTGTPASKQFYETPNIDRIAARGVSFTQAYAAPLCSPTRAALMTGKYAATLGFTTATPGDIRNYYNQGEAPPDGYLLHDMLPEATAPPDRPLIRGTTLMALPSGYAVGEPDVTTFAEAMSGHHRAFIGKWHLGSHGAAGHQPQDNGFDEVLSHIDSGSSPYFNWQSWLRDGRNLFTGENLGSISRFDSRQDYLTDDMGARVADFIRRRQGANPDAPWMLAMSLVAVHSPLQAKRADIAYFDAKPAKGWNGHRNAVYAGMIKSMDDAVGRVLDALEATGAMQSTVIIFMSDNGGVAAENLGAATSNAPLRGGKAQIYEGGVRVPMIVSAPFLHHPINVTSDVMVDATDIAPTILDLAGYDASAFVAAAEGDGESIRPLLTDPANSSGDYSRDTLYYHYPYYVAVTTPFSPPTSGIRKGAWKLIVDETGYVQLYNIAMDISEERDLSTTYPTIASRLYWLLRAWQDEKVPERYRSTPNPDYDPAAESNWRPRRELDKVYAAQKFSSIEGDFNLDGNVDQDDLDYWKSRLGTTGNPPSDSNGDGIFDDSDLLIWQRNVGRTIYDPQIPTPKYVFDDTFDVSADSADLGFELMSSATRQMQGILRSNYSGQAAAGNLGLEAARAVNGVDGVLMLRTAGSAKRSPQWSAVDLDASFGPQVAGKTWRLEYDAYSKFSSRVLPRDSWVAVSLGDTAGLDGPISAAVDYSLLLRPQESSIVLWQDGSNRVLGSGVVTDSSDRDAMLSGDRYHTTIEVVESADGRSAVVHVSFTMLEGFEYSQPGVTTTLSPVSITFDGLDRFIEFRIYSGAYSEHEYHEYRIDNLRVSVVDSH